MNSVGLVSWAVGITFLGCSDPIFHADWKFRIWIWNCCAGAVYVVARKWTPSVVCTNERMENLVLHPASCNLCYNRITVETFFMSLFADCSLVCIRCINIWSSCRHFMLDTEMQVFNVICMEFRPENPIFLHFHSASCGRSEFEFWNVIFKWWRTARGETIYNNTHRKCYSLGNFRTLDRLMSLWASTGETNWLKNITYTRTYTKQ